MSSEDGPHESLLSAGRTEGTPTSVVFSSPSVYHPLTYLLLAAAPLANAVAVAFMIKAREADIGTLWKVLFTTIAIILVFTLVLPKRFDVRSDGSIQVVAFLMTHTFENVSDVTEYPPFWSSEGLFCRRRVKFCTDLKNRLLVHRRDGCDVLVSPQDVPGFAQALRKVAVTTEKK